VLFSLIGCGGAGQSVEVLFADASSQLASAQKAQAEQFAKSEFEEARTLLSEATRLIEGGDAGALSLTKKAYAKARLAEALARQRKAETEAVRFEADLEKAMAEADRARLERQSAERELDQGSSD